MAGEKIGVTMGLDDPLDSQPGRCCVDEVIRDVAAGVDHDRAACRLIADEVGHLGQAREKILLKDHVVSPISQWATFTLRNR